MIKGQTATDLYTGISETLASPKIYRSQKKLQIIPNISFSVRLIFCSPPPAPPEDFPFKNTFQSTLCNSNLAVCTALAPGQWVGCRFCLLGTALYTGWTIMCCVACAAWIPHSKHLLSGWIVLYVGPHVCKYGGESETKSWIVRRSHDINIWMRAHTFLHVWPMLSQIGLVCVWDRRDYNFIQTEVDCYHKVTLAQRMLV